MSVSLVLAPHHAITPIDHGRLMQHASRRAWWLSAGFAAAILAAGALVHVDGAVVAGGEVAIADKVKKIAHPTGGIVSQIFVQEGDHVTANQPLIRLDDRTPLLSNALLGKSVEQLEARRARLVAERDALPAIEFPASLTGSAAPAAQQAIAEERRQFALARGGAGNVRAQLSERIRQLESQLGGFAAQSRSLSEQRRLLQPELDGMQQLWEKRLVPLSRVNGLQRSSIELVSATAAVSAQQAAARSQIAELRQKMSEVSGDNRTRAGTELAEVEAQLAEQRMRAASSQDVVDRSVIRAPRAGIVSKLLVGTVGGVLPATETVAEIVPDGSDLMVAARISPTDIDRVTAGGEATLRFSAFNAQTTPVIDGVVQRVAPDVSVDPRTGGSYYNAVIAVPRDQARRLGQATLVSGMPVEVMVRTGGRSLLSYIFKPLRDQFERAFRQD